MLRHCLIASLLVHMAVVVLVTMPAKAKPRQETGLPATPERSELRTELRPWVSPRIAPTGTGTCPHSYFGVGLSRLNGTHVVDTAPKHLPAYLAGVRPGDVLLDHYDRVAEGESVKLDVRRGKHLLHLHVTRKWICEQF